MHFNKQYSRLYVYAHNTRTMMRIVLRSLNKLHYKLRTSCAYGYKIVGCVQNSLMDGLLNPYKELLGRKKMKMKMKITEAFTHSHPAE